MHLYQSDRVSGSLLLKLKTCASCRHARDVEVLHLCRAIQFTYKLFLLNVKLSVSYQHQTWEARNYWLFLLFLDITSENEGQLWIWQQFAFFRNLISTIAIKCCWEGFNMLVAVFTLVPWSGLRSWEKCLQKPFRITPELWESRCAAVIQRNRF